MSRDGALQRMIIGRVVKVQGKKPPCSRKASQGYIHHLYTCGIFWAASFSIITGCISFQQYSFIPFYWKASKYILIFLTF